MFVVLAPSGEEESSSHRPLYSNVPTREELTSALAMQCNLCTASRSDLERNSPAWLLEALQDVPSGARVYKISSVKSPQKVGDSDEEELSVAELKAQVESLKREKADLHVKLKDAVGSVKSFHAQQRKLYDGFKILRAKCDDLKAESAVTMWEYIPSKVKGFEQLGDGIGAPSVHPFSDVTNAHHIVASQEMLDLSWFRGHSKVSKKRRYQSESMQSLDLEAKMEPLSEFKSSDDQVSEPNSPMFAFGIDDEEIPAPTRESIPMPMAEAKSDNSNNSSENDLVALNKAKTRMISDEAKFSDDTSRSASPMSLTQLKGRASLMETDDDDDGQSEKFKDSLSLRARRHFSKSNPITVDTKVTKKYSSVAGLTTSNPNAGTIGDKMDPGQITAAVSELSGTLEVIEGAAVLAVVAGGFQAAADMAPGVMASFAEGLAAVGGHLPYIGVACGALGGESGVEA